MDKIDKKLTTIENAISVIKRNMATKDDIKNMATKDDLKNLESGFKSQIKHLEVRLIEKIDEAEMEIIQTVDKHKADKESIAVLEKRVERLEDNAGLPLH